MYTQCLHCWSILAIRAEAIRAGRGKARCGHCFEEFDVLNTLSDTLAELLAETAGRSSENDLVFGSNWAQKSASADPSEASAHTPSKGTVAGGVLMPLKAAAVEPPPGGDAEVTDLVPSAGATDDGVAEVLREELEAAATARAQATRRLAFGAGSLILVVALAAQWIWFSSEALSERYPALLAVLTSFCGYSGCTLANRRDPTQIHMLSRDVRIHPDYEGALRVVATMVNRLPYAQPYPQMRFTLFNVNGEVIVGRTFRPAEYLASDIDTTAGMPSLAPVQIVLDLLALEEAAVSFEFRFL